MDPTVKRQVDPGQTLDDRFQIIHRLGKGGVGEVFKVLDLDTQRERALKLLQHQHVTDAATVEQFKREAAARGIADNHPAIVDVYAVGTLRDGRPFMLMELLSGVDLEVHAAALPGQRLELDEALRATMVAADAVGAAHERGLLHRDLKPSNIFRLAVDDFRVLDFGMATLMSTLAAKGGGTPSFSAPEQWLEFGRPAKQTDVFGLGATLYTLIAGTPPLCRLVPGAANAQLITALLERPVLPPLTEAPAAVRAVVERALRMEPGERFADARAFAEALRAAAPSVQGVRAVALTPDPVPKPPPRHSRWSAETLPSKSAGPAKVARVDARLEAAREEGAQSIAAVLRVAHTVSATFATDMTSVLRSLRSLGGFEELLTLFEALPPALVQRPELRELQGFSLNRLGRQAEAERELTALFAEAPTGERAGLLARVFKDQYAEAARDGELVRARGFLRRAIDVYLRGFELDPDDPYCGVNALTLMEVLDGEESGRAALLADVARCTEARLARDGHYWDHATMLELAVLQGDASAAKAALAQCLARTEGLDRWAPLSTARTLAMIGRAREARRVEMEWIRPLIDRLVQLSGDLQQAT